MANLRAIITIAVPAMTALLGLLWYFGRKKPPTARRLVDPPDKNRRAEETDRTTSSELSENKASVSSSSSEVLNGQAGKCGIDLPEIRTSGYKFVEAAVRNTCHAEPCITGSGDARHDVIEAPTIISEVDTVQETVVKPSETEPLVTKVGEPVREVTNVPAIIPDVDTVQETVVKPSYTEPCTSDRNSNSPTDISTRDSDLHETTKTSPERIEESIIAHTQNESVLAAPEFSSPKPEEIITADLSQEQNVINFTENASLPSNTSDNIPGTVDIISDRYVPDGAEAETDRVNSEVNCLSSSQVGGDQLILQTEPLTRSWHEDLPEIDKCLDLVENMPGDTDHDQQIVQINSDTISLPAQEANHLVRNARTDSDKTCASKDLNSLSDSRTENQSENLQSSPCLQTDHKQSESENTNNNHSDSSSNCDNLSEASNDSGKGGSVHENANASPPDEDRIFEFNIPTDLCGLFIGTRGKTIKMISQQSGTKLRLQNNPYTRDFQICVIEGQQNGIDTACDIIKRKFPSIKYPGMDMKSAVNPVIMPEIMQLSLPEGVSVDIVVSSIVDAGRIFVQQPTHPTFPSLDRLNTFMSQCYIQEGAVPDIPHPIESGVICAAPMLNGWYRAQIMAAQDDSGECDIKYVDYGGYSHVSSSLLKQIRSDFMTLPFEAVECYLANITPLESEEYFSAEAGVVLEELTQGKLLQGQVVGRAEDGLPYVHVYQICGTNSVVLVNRELVNRGVVRWMELME